MTSLSRDHVPPATTCQHRSSVLALIDEPSRVARLRAAWGNALQACDTQVDLVVASRATGVELVVIPTRDRHGQSLVTTVAAIRASRQNAAVHVYADRTAGSMRELMALAIAGARGVIVRDVDDDPASLRQLLVRGSLARAIETMTLAVQQVVPLRQRPLVLLCIEHVNTPIAANAFALRLGVSRRTLSGWAARVGSRGVRPLMSKCRVLVALQLLRESERSIEQVAHSLRFASSAHLHNTIRRYTGASPRAAAAHGVEAWCHSLLVAPPTGVLRSAGRVTKALPLAKMFAPRAEWSTAPNDATLQPRNMTP